MRHNVSDVVQSSQTLCSRCRLLVFTPDEGGTSQTSGSSRRWPVCIPDETQCLRHCALIAGEVRTSLTNSSRLRRDATSRMSGSRRRRLVFTPDEGGTSQTSGSGRRWPACIPDERRRLRRRAARCW